MVIEVLEGRTLMSVSAYPTADFDAIRNGGVVGGAGTSADRCDPNADVRNYDAAGRIPDQGGGGTGTPTLVTDSGDGDLSSTCRK